MMTAKFEELRVLKTAEALADEIWQRVTRWDNFPKDVVGKQWTRAAGSIGANISEAFGRFHYGERLQFLYFARGSLFETKYWLNRAVARNLISAPQAQLLSQQLSELTRQLNAFAAHVKSLRNIETRRPKALREALATYGDTPAEVFVPDPLIAETELAWLTTP
jgi:four helix bundle protein